MSQASMTEEVLSRIENIMLQQGLTAEQPVVLMVSGGSDSTALAYAAAALRNAGKLQRVVMLHMNHKIRGAESDADARFVAGLSQMLEIPLFSCEEDIPRIVSETGKNLEAVARSERYYAAHEALKSACEHLRYDGEDGVAFTAHTADDRVENFYMRSIVGTGPGGFRSMYYSSYVQGVRVVHPLLDMSRDDLRAFIEEQPQIYAGEEGEHWREDSTNTDTDSFRAFVRHEIIPRAKERNPKLLDTLIRTMNLIADEDDMMASYARQVLIERVQPLGQIPQEGMLVSPELAEEPLPVQRRVIKRMLSLIFTSEERVENQSVEACLSALGASGEVRNIQNNYAVSYNKQGLRVEPMESFRARRNRI